jgi:6-phosphogluconolactonase
MAFMAAGAGWAQSSGRTVRVFVGCYTNGSGERVPTDFGTHRGADDVSLGLSTFSFDTETGRAGPITLAARCSSPVNLIMHSNRRVLYACRGQSTRLDGQNIITAFAIEADGGLREMNTVRSGGGGPTVGTVDSRGRFLLTTNFASDSIVCFQLHPDGSFASRTALIGIEPDGMPTPPGPPGSMPEPVECDEASAGTFACRERTKPHAVVLSPDERFAIAAEINSNRCRVMRFDPDTGSLEPHQLAPDADGAGPRHLAWHPSFRFLYSSGEHNSSISSWRWDGERGELVLLQNLTSLPAGFEGNNHPADVVMHPSGKFVYVTNRGTGTIAGYRIDPTTGHVAAIGDTAIGSPACWSMRFDPTGKWAIAAAQIGDEIVFYSVDNDSGQLDATGQTLHTILPSCLRLA